MSECSGHTTQTRFSEGRHLQQGLEAGNHLFLVSRSLIRSPPADIVARTSLRTFTLI